MKLAAQRSAWSVGVLFCSFDRYKLNKEINKSKIKKQELSIHLKNPLKGYIMRVFLRSGTGSAASAAGGFFRLTSPRFFFSPAPLQSFSPDNPQFHPEGADCGAKKPWKGMDMRKISSHKFVSHKVSRVPMTSGRVN